MAKADEIQPARPVIAVEYDGRLFPTFQSAEGARAHSDLTALLSKQRSPSFSHLEVVEMSARMDLIELVIKNADKVHGILSRYLDAAKIELPKTSL